MIKPLSLRRHNRAELNLRTVTKVFKCKEKLYLSGGSFTCLIRELKILSYKIIPILSCL